MPKTSFEIPVYCSQCQAVYSSGVTIGPQTRMFMRGNVFYCRRGHTTEMLEGTFEVHDGVLQVGGSSVIEKISRIAEDAVSGKTNTDQAVKAISELAPTLAPILRAFGSDRGLLALALVLWFIVQMTTALNKQGSSGSPPINIHIENRPAIVNQITVDQALSQKTEFPPTESDIKKHDKKNH